MSSRNLLILTKRFPYSVGEEFLESELPVLARKFNKIFIIATSVPYGKTLERKVPDNVKYIKFEETSSNAFKFVKYYIKGLFCKKNKVQIEELIRNGLSKKVFIKYFLGKCNSIYNKIVENLEFKEFINNSDLIIYSYWFADLAYIAALLKENYKIDFFCSRAHGYDLYEYRNRFGIIPFRKYVFNSIDRIYPCSKDGEHYLKRKYPQFSSKIELSYLGTRDGGINLTNTKGTYRIVTCSNIIPLKRLDLLAESIVILESKGLCVDWYCIGDGKELNALKKYAKYNFKRSKAIFFGRVSNKEIFEIYRNTSFNLFINVSENEGLPVSIMEAISFGIPCLATNVGGTSEIINSCTGKLIPPNIDKYLLADEIEVMMGKSFDRSKIRKFWENNFLAEKNYEYFSENLLDLT